MQGILAVVILVTFLLCVSLSKEKLNPPRPEYSYFVSDDKQAYQANKNKGKKKTTINQFTNEFLPRLQSCSPFTCTSNKELGDVQHPMHQPPVEGLPCTHPRRGIHSQFLLAQEQLTIGVICSKTRLFWLLLFKMQSPSEALDKPTLFGKRTSTLLSSIVKRPILILMELFRIYCIYCIY